MVKIRGMSKAENFLTDGNGFGHCPKLSSLASFRYGWHKFNYILLENTEHICLVLGILILNS